MIKVLVIDDSAFMRKALSTMLEGDPEIQVVGTARDGSEGLDKARQLQPDVITLDIEMPRMDGLTALRHIMMEMPRPVIMVSSLTTEGAEATLKALELGAVDFIPKQLSRVSLDIVKIENDLRSKVKTVARRKIRAPRAPRKIEPVTAPTIEKPSLEAIPQKRSQSRDVVAIGVSTGGPPAIQKVLSKLPANFPACILIAQHMPQAFTGPFAKRLDAVCQIKVKEAEAGDRVQAGMAFVAPGGQHLSIDQKVSRIDLLIGPEPKEALYKPSANVLIASVAQGVGKRGVGVILTGMGSDGLEGIKQLRQKNGYILAQDDASCVVYGMPKAIVDAGLADEILDIDDIAQGIMNALYR
ncbi:chemotaxis response regulator protein-glutamate methylesterase [Desulfonatronum sp. SC1]|uniref:protein-glutamate methylesterase/protein-glutamine glutaminase n=1 Tax=Desulfonatronum sp. SC1 TaxID=2109626 RepID=UPI000D2FE8E6|nr:chemotaxis response regulator protein-glutamate methylesterase [Desulfonatronum sp. SC1]PTN34347.1 chemotaxis response regulator protein-glutamate methylesterase [Desulfonatronum sp. SC1]